MKCVFTEWPNKRSGALVATPSELQEKNEPLIKKTVKRFDVRKRAVIIVRPSPNLAWKQKFSSRLNNNIWSLLMDLQGASIQIRREVSGTRTLRSRMSDELYQWTIGCLQFRDVIPEIVGRFRAGVLVPINADK